MVEKADRANNLDVIMSNSARVQSHHITFIPVSGTPQRAQSAPVQELPRASLKDVSTATNLMLDTMTGAHLDIRGIELEHPAVVQRVDVDAARNEDVAGEPGVT